MTYSKSEGNILMARWWRLGWMQLHICCKLLESLWTTQWSLAYKKSKSSSMQWLLSIVRRVPAHHRAPALSLSLSLGGTGVWTQGLTLCQLFCVCVGFFWDRASRTICLGWLWNMILLISASWVARTTGVSHQCSAHCPFSDASLLVSLPVEDWAV
jgi:hypothetical protein